MRFRGSRADDSLSERPLLGTCRKRRRGTNYTGELTIVNTDNSFVARRFPKDGIAGSISDR